MRIRLKVKSSLCYTYRLAESINSRIFYKNQLKTVDLHIGHPF